MTINATDIKLLESERMSDTTDGGGRRTSRVIPDGVAGNIFPKVSRLDSVYGRVNLRKVYGAVQTANVDTYAGSHAIITDAPDNANIHCTLFSTASEFDTRAAARDRIESYVTSGPESRMVLLGRQLPGQQSILVYQRVEEPIPDIGTVFCLSNEVGNVVSSQQYARVQDVSHEVRTFEDEKGAFQRRVLTLDVGTALRYEFSGPTTASRYSDVARSSRIRDTTVVDAARYYGIQKLAEPADSGDLQVRVASVYTPIVPTTNRETAIANENLSDARNIIPSAETTITETLTAFAVSANRFTRRGILPGSLTLSGPGIPAVTDDSLGNIASAAFSATVDYENGTITRTGGTAGTVDTSAAYTPAVSVSQPAHSREIPVSLNNRGTVYSLTLNPLPAPGSLIVDYRALGKWYRLRDIGDGTLAGIDPAYGVGSISYVTGTLVVTLGALPDVDSAVIAAWGSPSHYEVRAGSTSDAATKMQQTFILPDLPVSPDSVAVTYTANSTQYTATDDATGNITGNGITGKVNYTTGEVNLEYTIRLPDANTNVDVSYNQIVPVDPQAPVVKSLATNSQAVTDLGEAITAGSLVGSVYFRAPVGSLGGYVAGNVVVVDNGSGLLIARGGQVVGGNGNRHGTIGADTVVGNINYSTGTVTINGTILTTTESFAIISFAAAGSVPGAQAQSSDRGTQNVNMSVQNGVANWGWKSAASGTNSAKTYSATFSEAPIRLNLTASVGDRVVPGSVMFSAGGKTFVDRNGTLYTDVVPATGAGTPAGSIDYESGDVSLATWTNGASLALAVASCLTEYSKYFTNTVFFRTPGAPLRPGSFYVQATAVDGTLVQGTSNDSGNITGTLVAGEVDQETGVVRLAFGQWVTATGHEGEPWYSPSLVVGGQIFAPTFIQPSTLTFNCVVLTNLPLNADILGLDPVRLPADGRVPIYRPADVLVIHNTKVATLTNPVTQGATYNVGRTDLSELAVVDQNGVALLDNQYTYNLVAGTVTIAADFVAGSLVQPLKVRHRVEDMLLATDVQINGQLAFAAPLSRDYDADSYVSSALLFGDMNARVTGVFDIATFSTWSDTPGAGATAQYNNIDYPIEILNNGGMTERWRINFLSANTFQVIGENLGVIGTGTTSADCAPTNQLTGQPYFVIRAEGWGSGWSAGNQLRFNTTSAAAPIWIARTTLPGATLAGDSFSMQLRGDVDAG